MTGLRRKPFGLLVLLRNAVIPAPDNAPLWAVLNSALESLQPNPVTPAARTLCHFRSVENEDLRAAAIGKDSVQVSNSSARIRPA